MAEFNVAESNSNPTSTVAGSVSQAGTGFQVLGVAFAGRSTTGTGSGAAFQGIYGTLHLNADGSFSYVLDNSDADTNQLATGEVTDEVFTYTYTLNGQTFTDRLTFHIGGADEAGQVVHAQGVQLTRTGDLTVAANERYEFAAEHGIFSASDADGDLILNNGSIRLTSPTFEGYVMALDPNQYYQGGTQLINNGRISATVTGATTGASSVVTGIGVSGITQPQTVNNGVIQIRNNVSGASFGSDALAVAAGNALNTGLVEVISTYGRGTAYNLGLYSPTLFNSGVIRVTGGGIATTNPLSQIGIYAAGSQVHIENSGTIAVTATGAGSHSIAINIFPNNSNVYQGGEIINSGRIIAEIAIQGTEGYANSLSVTNTGYIEGDYLRDFGHDVLTNAAGATWIGNFTFGRTADMMVNAGTITGRINLGDGADYFDGRGGTVSGVVDGGAGHDVLIGGGAADTLIGGDGNDAIQGGGGADTLSGGAGADLFVYAAASDSTAAARDTITDFVSGTDRIDLSRLGASNITITASGNLNIIAGDSAGGAFSIAVSGAVAMGDLITTPQTTTLAGGAGDDVLIAALTGVTLNGAAGSDTLIGSTGADVLDGGTGADTLFGGDGDDVYIIDNDGDRVLETATGGHDLVRTYVDYSLQYWVEDGTIIGNAAVGLLGTAANNVLTGNAARNEINAMAGDDVIIGGGGGDYLIGGAGADRFVYLDPTDSVQGAMDYLRYFEHGTDIIDLRNIAVTSLSFDVQPNNNVTMFFTDVRITTASGATMLIRVDDKASLADFLLANTQHGTDGADEINGGANNDVIIGGAGDDILRGYAGTDIIDGGIGADKMDGGAGDDQYFVDQQGDLVFEAVGGGTDTVVSTASYYLYDNVENLTLFAESGALYGVGNALDNVITGNSAANLLLGGGGNDTLFGGLGDDQLFGEDGNDTLYGGDGKDVLQGGAGNDYIDGGAWQDWIDGGDGDDVLWGGGRDVLIGAYATDVLIGGAGNDVLHGEDGDGEQDHLYGGTGNDTYYVDAQNDFTYENAGEGTDTVYADIAGGTYYLFANVENLILQGTTLYGVGNELANAITGSDATNWLLGGAGNDRIDGGRGNDVLYGQDGADTFVFGASSGIDTIADFTPGTDKIDLSAYGFANFAAVQAAMTDQGGGIMNIALGNGNYVILTGVTKAQLSAGDFILSSTAQAADKGDVMAPEAPAKGAPVMAVDSAGKGAAAETIVLDDAVQPAPAHDKLAALFLRDAHLQHGLEHQAWHQAPFDLDAFHLA